MTPRLPVTGRAAAAIALALVLNVGGYFGVVAPRAREVARLAAQLSASSTPTPSATTAAPVTDAERARWQEIDTLVRQRFVPPEDQMRVALDVGQIARAAGVAVIDLRLEGAGGGPGASGATEPPTLPSATPPNLAVNAGTISMSARHGYRELIDFLDQMARGNRYVALQTLDVRRVGNYLESNIRLASLRWTEP